MRFTLDAGDYNDSPDEYKELGEETIEAATEDEAKEIYCKMKGIDPDEFADRHWDLLSGSCNYMWLDE